MTSNSQKFFFTLVDIQCQTCGNVDSSDFSIHLYNTKYKHKVDSAYQIVMNTNTSNNFSGEIL